MSESNGEGLLIGSLSTTRLDAPPSCIEFSPLAPDVLVVGSYVLHSRSSDAADPPSESAPDQKRTGGLYVFRLEDESRVTLLQARSIDAAILDLHFSPRDRDVLAVAQSDGVLSFWRLSGKTSLDHLHDLLVDTASDLVLSLAWSPYANAVAATTSAGRLVVIDLDESWGRSTVETSGNCYANSHRLEAWTLAWSPKPRVTVAEGSTARVHEQNIYCGGDDAVICMWDVRILAARKGKGEDAQLEEERFLLNEVPAQRLKGTAPYSCHGLLFDAATHDAGVTAILPLPSDGPAELVLTGSYDEHIRVISPTPRGRWRVLAERRLDGGVWRLKILHQTLKTNGNLNILVLASCMHAGPRVVRIVRDEADNWSIDVVARFEEHESMNYCSDAVRTANAEGVDRFAIVSTSFYDRRLCVWTVEAVAGGS